MDAWKAVWTDKGLVKGPYIWKSQAQKVVDEWNYTQCEILGPAVIEEVQVLPQVKSDKVRVDSSVLGKFWGTKSWFEWRRISDVDWVPGFGYVGTIQYRGQTIRVCQRDYAEAWITFEVVPDA